MSVTRGSENGQVSTVYRFRCADCRAIYDAEGADGKATLDRAVVWARGDGWSLGSDGFWRCKHHAPEHRARKKSGP